MSSSTTPGYPRVEGHGALLVDVVAVMGPDGTPIPLDPDLADTWFVGAVPAQEADPDDELVLRFGGLATVAEVTLDGESILTSDSMFATHEVALGSGSRPAGELRIRCQALAPILAVPRRPRARWRSRIVEDNQLRWIRTTIEGRAPGFAPGPPAVGPWRPIWLERRRRLVVEDLRIRARVDDTTGVVEVDARLRSLGDRAISAVRLVADGPTGEASAALAVSASTRGAAHVHGELRIDDPDRWWPHTHGRPTRYRVRLVVELSDGEVRIDAAPVGFRTLAAGPTASHDVERDGLDLHVNGVRVFARGALWMPLSTPAGRDPLADLDRTLAAVRDAGMNMIRIPGMARYEAEAFHDRCDALGILVWQDAAFANLDYPFADPAFQATATAEVSELLERIAGRPSTAILCGNSEIEQQVAMLGRPNDEWRDPFFGETIPSLARAAGSDAIVVPSAPFGGDRPFVPDRGLANYYGVGGYRRPLSDARLAGVRFAAECLAFSNVPDEAAVARVLPEASTDLVVHHPAWKAGVPRDAGTGWDFEDVRDHYLRAAGTDPHELRRTDHARYLVRSRAVTGELMAAVFGEWRRPASPCGGGLILWLRDVRPGAGWGVLDDQGDPKVAYHHVRRAMAPIAVWLTDEGLAGVAVHVANDPSSVLRATLRLSLYRDGEVRVGSASEALDLQPHSAISLDVERLLGGFVDASWAYRFGPPGQDVIVATLESEGADGPNVLSQAFLFPAGRPTNTETADRLGLSACAEPDGDRLAVTVRSRRLVDGVRLVIPGHVPADDAFTIEPGGERHISLRPTGTMVPGDDQPPSGAAGWLTALSLSGRLAIPMTSAT